MTQFGGFPADTSEFLADLGDNNNRTWFEANKTRYQRAFVEPAKAFVSAIAPHFARFAPEIHAEPRVNGSIFRINRDIRFSADKTPYKDHLDLWFWRASRTSGPGFFLRLTHDTLHLGTGCHAFDSDGLGAYRQAVLDGVEGSALDAVAGEVVAQGYLLGGEHYKRVPRGLPADHLRARWLRRNSLYAHIEFDHTDVPLHDAAIVAVVADHFRALLPLYHWLSRVITGTGA